ncbi:MAG: AraC family transcriptional regulator, partial [Lachnospiraceae bacterium]|nr:AraC family transcriptional regulator [Lachnospiraceae bacterium]
MKHHLEEVRKQLHQISNESSITTWQLYPGIELSFVDCQAEQLSVHHDSFNHILQLNYCREGRLGWRMNNGNTVYLGPHDYSLHMMDSCSDSEITLPNGSYSGLILCFDLTELSENPPELLAETGITVELLCHKFCANKTFTSLAGNEETEAIFSSFFCQPDNLQMTYWKIKTIELLLYLSKSDNSAQRYLTGYQSEQVKIIREIHENLVTHLDQRLTIEYLSKQYLMNPTTLKNVFKAVYGTSIAAHMKEHRMKYAARLLLETNDAIIQISKAVGYDTQSKFTAAFKDYFQILPTEYRKQHYREQ